MCRRRGRIGVALAFLMVASGAVARGEEGPTLEPVPEADEVVVTASRQPLAKGEETATLTVVGREEIESQGAAFLDEALRDTPGLVVNRLGGIGEETHLFMRASESDHVLVMIDGHQVNTDGGVFDWKNLANQNVERIEVLRGTGSALYGSDALVGAVNIITRRPTGPDEVKASLEGGTYGTMRETLSAAGSGPMHDYTVSLARFDRKDYKIDRTDYEDTTLWGSAGASLGEDVKLRFVFRAEDAERDWGSTSGPPTLVTPDPDAYNERQSSLFGLETVIDAGEKWTARIKMSSYNQDEIFHNEPDAANVAWVSEDQYNLDQGFERFVFDWQNEVVLGEGPNGRLDMVLGFEFDRESLDHKEDYANAFFAYTSQTRGSNTRASRAGYLQLREELYGWLRLEGNYRHENHDALGNEDSYRLAAAGVFEELGLRIRASAGKAYKEPTIFETHGSSMSSFGPTQGNPDLEPEGCTGFDVGAQQELLGGKLVLGTTFFRNRYGDFIIWDYSGPVTTFANAGRARSEGWEHFIEYRPTETLSVRANYTHNNHRATESDNTSLSFLEGERLIRRPNDIFNLRVGWRPVEKLGLNFEWHHVGSRDDVLWDPLTFWTPTRVRLKGYDRVDASVSFRINRHLRVFGRWENIGDATYEDAAGFEAPGSAFLGGIEWRTSF